MSKLNADSRRLLKEIFPRGVGAYVVSARYDAQDVLKPGREGPAGTVDLPDDHDLYYCVAEIAPGRDRTDGGRVRVVVIDDVGKEIPRELYELAPFLPEPSFIVESSAGSFQYGYVIEGGMDPDDYRALRRAMKASTIYGQAHNTGATAIFRLPQGTHTKSTRAGFKPRVEKWTDIKYREADVWAAVGGAPAQGSGGGGSTADLVEDEELLKALVDMIPNPAVDWEFFVAVGRAIWAASAGAGFDIFEAWAAKLPEADTGLTHGRWDSYPSTGSRIGRFWLLREARTADPAGAEAWLAREAKAVFAVDPPDDDGGGGGTSLPRAKQLRYAQEVARLFGEGMRYVLDRKGWAVVDATGLWRHLPGGVKAAAQHSIEMAARAPAKGKGDHDVLTLSFHDGVEGLCRQLPGMVARETDFDRDPWKFGTPGGTVDLRTGVLAASTAADMISKSAAVAPSEGVECRRWLKFIEEVTEKDAESALFLQQYAGYGLTGLTKEQVFLFLYGPGGNGKSVFADMLAWVMGDYAVQPVADLFVKKAHGVGHTSKLAMLAGARLCTISEVSAGAQWDEGLLKDVTGGARITAGFKHRDEFTFAPAFKILALGNHQPTFPGGIDDAIKRRFRMMEFKFKPRVPDPDLMDKLKAEAPGILRWMIEGCLMWQRTSLTTPQKVADATEALFAEQDLVGQWIAARIEKVKGSKVSGGDLFRDWIEWRNEQGDHELLSSPTAFGREITERKGLVKKQGKGQVEYQDLKLRVKITQPF